MEVQEAVGAVRSITTEAAVAASAKGPVLPAASLTELAASLPINVPSEQDEAVTVTDEPEEAEGVKTQPVAVPVFVKSAEVSPLIVFEKVRV